MGRRSIKESRLIGFSWVLPSILVILLVQLLPMLYAVWLSLQDKRTTDRHARWAGLDNYRELLTTSEFWSSLGRGAVYGFGSVALQLTFGLVFALLLHRRFAGRGIARAVTMLPYMLPTASVALVFALMFNNLYGIVNRLLVDWGILDQPILFFGDDSWAMPAVIAVAVWKWTPFAVIVLLARLQAIDDTLYESAAVEGAGRWRSFLDITLPSLRSSIFLIVLLRGIWMLNKFDIPYLLTYGGPNDATQTTPIYAYNVFFQQFQQGRGAAVAVLMTLALLVVAVPYFIIVRPEREVRVE